MTGVERVDDCTAGGGGGGRTEEIGGRDVPLVQLLEHTLKCVAQFCMHWFQYWV